MWPARANLSRYQPTLVLRVSSTSAASLIIITRLVEECLLFKLCTADKLHLRARVFLLVLISCYHPGWKQSCVGCTTSACSVTSGTVIFCAPSIYERESNGEYDAPASSRQLQSPRLPLCLSADGQQPNR